MPYLSLSALMQQMAQTRSASLSEMNNANKDTSVAVSLANQNKNTPKTKEDSIPSQLPLQEYDALEATKQLLNLDLGG